MTSLVWRNSPEGFEPCVGYAEGVASHLRGSWPEEPSLRLLPPLRAASAPRALGCARHPGVLAARAPREGEVHCIQHGSAKEKTPVLSGVFSLAEPVGFEPTVGF